MKTATLLTASTALPIVAVLALAGCGGGGRGGVAASMLEPATGLTASDHTPVPENASSANDTLAALLPDASNSFAPLSSSLKRDFGNNTAAISDTFHIKSISSDGYDGFKVTYVIDGVEKTVDFAKGDYDNTAGEYQKDIDGETYYLWSYTDSFDGSDKNLGSSEFEYFDANGSSVPGGDRTIVTYGARTAAGSMPGGTATYDGRMRADSFDNNDTARRTRIHGLLTLTANFADATLGGRIFALRVRAPGETDYTRLPATTDIDISNGRIVDGRFTASLTGRDEDPDALLGNSARGYYGDAYGEFYGPAAEEVGGVLNARRDEDNMVLNGWFGGWQSREIAIDDSTQPSALVQRDFSASTTAASSSTATVEARGTGYRITFTIGETEEILDVTEDDLGGLGLWIGEFEKSIDTATESKRIYLWRERGWFPGRPAFDYMDVHGVFLADYAIGANQSADDPTGVTSGFLVRGTRTTDMPTSGSASYSGGMEAKEWRTDTLQSYRDATEYRGAFSMTADFSAGSVTGSVSNVESRPGNSGQYTSSADGTGLTFNATVSDNAISASALTGAGDLAVYTTGSVEGAFYGPEAAEAGGVFEGTATNKLLQGWFAGSKQ